MEMGLLSRLRSAFSRDEGPSDEREGKGLIVFESARDAMKAERTLKEAGYDVRAVAPPPEIREGCDLAIEYDLVDEVGVRRTLEEIGVEPLKFVSLEDPSLKPIELVRVKEVDGYIMVRCGNMKVTVDRDGTIVNVSGGGCPDVPYLAHELVGKNVLELSENSMPASLGYTLCAYTLDKAVRKAKEVLLGEGS
ncbi:Uncharacterized protein conserved in archaea [Methanopyrus kandleri AV19]|uniref:Uncharacterized protein conserved in archaea n=2 Tax=Methanopyrus kandleri TaxID=2320 RepID=Q8TYN2_METKA|nr:Uncharacterized protein conserved in archaea [Methanopyrus kandleri AV19]